MSVTATTHLNFNGTARAALEFYKSALGGTVTIVPYGKAAASPAESDNVMWGQVEAPNGFRVMAYDVSSKQTYDPGKIPFYLALRGDTGSEIKPLWDKLADGATVLTPLGASAWSPLYGMLTDRFGVTWVIDAVRD